MFSNWLCYAYWCAYWIMSTSTTWYSLSGIRKYWDVRLTCTGFEGTRYRHIPGFKGSTTSAANENVSMLGLRFFSRWTRPAEKTWRKTKSCLEAASRLPPGSSSDLQLFHPDPDLIRTSIHAGLSSLPFQVWTYLQVCMSFMLSQRLQWT